MVLNSPEVATGIATGNLKPDDNEIINVTLEDLEKALQKKALLYVR